MRRTVTVIFLQEKLKTSPNVPDQLDGNFETETEPFLEHNFSLAPWQSCPKALGVVVAM